MAFSANLVLREQLTSVLVEIYKKIPCKVDKNGKVNSCALKVLQYLNERGYDVKKLITETF